MASAREVVRRDLQAWREADADAYVDCYTGDAVISTSDGVVARGRDDIRQFMQIWIAAAPDNEIHITHEYVVGPVVVHEAIFRGTHTGDLGLPDGQVIPPTGRTFELAYAEVFTVEGERIAAQRLYYDRVQLLTQLGLNTALETSAKP